MTAQDHDSTRFPDGFLWGAATSSYQIEGAVREGGRGPSIWDTFSHTPGKTAGGDTGDIAVDHFHRWPQDIAMMQELGIQAYRFSVAWPRVIPQGTGSVNQAGLDFYDRLVDGLLESGIEPWLTLYHWDLPQPLGDEGGLTNRDVADAFERYAAVLTERLGDRVKRWCTVNEPFVAGFLGYWFGMHAPGETSRAAGLSAVHNLLRMHGKAVDVVRDTVPDAKVGIALNLTSVYTLGDSEADLDAVRHHDGLANRWFLDALYKGAYPEDMAEEFGDDTPDVQDGDLALISRETDFLGVNYYTPAYVKAGVENPFGDPTIAPDYERTAMGWLVEPRGLQDLLVRINQDYHPEAIYITENGAAYDDDRPVDGRVHDPRRIAYYHGHLGAAHEAIEEGVPLKGYFAWSLMDNFEWAEGYSKRFGIVHVDFSTQERTPKDSARWYANVIEENAIQPAESVGR